MADKDISKPNKDLQIEQNKYHYNAYKNLVVTLVGLNSAGIGASLAFMSVVTGTRCKAALKTLPSCDILESSLTLFSIGLLLILIEIYTEYFSYFLYKKCISRQVNDIEVNNIFFKDLFSAIQIILIISSGILLLLGGCKLIQI